MSKLSFADVIADRLDRFESMHTETRYFEGNYNYEDVNRYREDVPWPFDTTQSDDDVRILAVLIRTDQYDLLAIRDVSTDVIVLVDDNKREVEWACPASKMEFEKKKDSHVTKSVFLDLIDNGHRFDEYSTQEMNLSEFEIYFESISPSSRSSGIHKYSFEVDIEEDWSELDSEDLCGRRVSREI
jgi:hypothetical protein